jgi:hypothetical protein
MNAHLGGSDCSGVNERETPQNKKEKKKSERREKPSVHPLSAVEGGADGSACEAFLFAVAK